MEGRLKNTTLSHHRAKNEWSYLVASFEWDTFRLYFSKPVVLSETMDESEDKVFKKEETEERVFSNNTRDYNRMTCSACNSVVKVHHLRRHLQNHNLSVAEYKDIYGSQYQYVLCSWHRCGICDMEMLFDLDTLYAHVNSLHDVKIKDYVEHYLTSEDSKPNMTAMDADGAPLLALQRRGMTVTALPCNPKPSHHTTHHSSKISHKSTHHKAKATKLKPFEAKFDPQSRRTVQCYSNGDLERVQDRDEDGYLISNDLADYMLVECQICNLHKPMTQLRSHTKAAHGITITEYKAQFGSDLEPVEPVYHRCGVCSQIIFLDSDAVAVHLKSGGHPRITHKDYNDTFMVDTRSSRQYVTSQEKEDRAEQRLMQGSPTISHRGLGGSVRGSVVRSTSSPLRGDEVVGVGTKMVPTRGRGWAGMRRGRGRPRGGSLKRSYEDDSLEYEADIFEGGNEIRHGRKSRRRARMGEGAYSEKSYDALLKLQQQEFECGDEWGENEEWQEGTNYEEDWGEEAWREVKQEEEEGEGDEEWNPKVETEDVHEEEVEDVRYSAEDSNSTSSFGNHATKSLHLGPKKLEVILLDDNADDDPDNDEKEEGDLPNDEEQETPMFNFNTFSTYNDKVVKARSESTEHECDVINDNLNSVESSSTDQNELNS